MAELVPSLIVLSFIDCPREASDRLIAKSENHWLFVVMRSADWHCQKAAALASVPGMSCSTELS